MTLPLQGRVPRFESGLAHLMEDVTETDDEDPIEELHLQIRRGINSKSIAAKHKALRRAQDILKDIKNNNGSR